MLFVIGGDGLIRGAMQIRRLETGLRVCVVASRNIDNDIHFIDRSFARERLRGALT